jgi:hypothetical protein
MVATVSTNPQPTEPFLRRIFASMGLWRAIDPNGSMVIVVPGNSIGVAMNDVPSIFILPIEHRNKFLKATGAKLIKNGIYRGEVSHFDLGLPHTERFVFKFRGHHVICAGDGKALTGFEHASNWLKPSQVTGGKRGHPALISARINMNQEAFELRAGITALIGFRMQFGGGAPKPGGRTLQWEKFVNKLINETQAIGITLSAARNAIDMGLLITPKATSQLAELIAAQRTVAPEYMMRFSLHHYLFIEAQAVNWRALSDYVAPIFGDAVRSKPSAKGKKVPSRPWGFPPLLKHTLSTVLVVRGDPKDSATDSADMLATFDSPVSSALLSKGMAGAKDFMPSGSLPKFKMKPVGAGGAAIDVLKGDRWTEEYRIVPVTKDKKALLMAPTASFARARRRLLKPGPPASPTGERLLRKMGRYLPKHLIAFTIISSRVSEAGAPKAAAGALAFPVYHRPVVMSISRSGSGLEVHYFVPLRLATGANPLMNLLP